MEKYELISQIGDGSFGTVAKAIDKKSGQLVAIKKMKQRFYSWEQCVKLPEVEIVRKIHSHPNIVKLREVIRENTELFFVFEFMDSDLLDVIKKAKQLYRQEEMGSSPAISYSKIKNYMRQILQSIAYIHKRGYFHRDLKPENLLIKRLDCEEIVKLADFGLAKEIRSRPPFTDYVSTRWYRAPELLLQDRNYGPSVDIWAAGCIMVELITTRPLFPGSNEVDQLLKIMDVLGPPSEKTWSDGVTLAKKIRYTFPPVQGRGLAKVLPKHSPIQMIDLISCMLTYDPKVRFTADQCLQHSYLSVGIDAESGPSLKVSEQLAKPARRVPLAPQSAPSMMQKMETPAKNTPNDLKSSPETIKDVSLPEAGSNPSKIMPREIGKLRLSVSNKELNTSSSLATQGLKNISFLPPQKPTASLQDSSSGLIGVSSGHTLSIQKKTPPPSKRSTALKGLKGMQLANVRQHVTVTNGIKMTSSSPLSIVESKVTQTPTTDGKPVAKNAPCSEIARVTCKPPDGKVERDKKESINLENLLVEFASDIRKLGLNNNHNDNDNAFSLKGKSTAPSLKHDPAKLLLNNTRYKVLPKTFNNEAVSTQDQDGRQRRVLAQINKYDVKGNLAHKNAELSPPNLSTSFSAFLTKFENGDAPR